jgi:hypothetical protein
MVETGILNKNKNITDILYDVFCMVYISGETKQLLCRLIYEKEIGRVAFAQRGLRLEAIVLPLYQVMECVHNKRNYQKQPSKQLSTAKSEMR